MDIQISEILGKGFVSDHLEILKLASRNEVAICGSAGAQIHIGKNIKNLEDIDFVCGGLTSANNFIFDLLEKIAFTNPSSISIDPHIHRQNLPVLRHYKIDIPGCLGICLFALAEGDYKFSEVACGDIDLTCYVQDGQSITSAMRICREADGKDTIILKELERISAWHSDIFTFTAGKTVYDEHNGIPLKPPTARKKFSKIDYEQDMPPWAGRPK